MRVVSYVNDIELATSKGVQEPSPGFRLCVSGQGQGQGLGDPDECSYHSENERVENRC